MLMNMSKANICRENFDYLEKLRKDMFAKIKDQNYLMYREFQI